MLLFCHLKEIQKALTLQRVAFKQALGWFCTVHDVSLCGKMKEVVSGPNWEYIQRQRWLAKLAWNLLESVVVAWNFWPGPGQSVFLWIWKANAFLVRCQKQSLRFEMEISHLDHLESPGHPGDTLEGTGWKKTDSWAPTAENWHAPWRKAFE